MQVKAVDYSYSSVQALGHWSTGMALSTHADNDLCVRPGEQYRMLSFWLGRDGAEEN